MSDPSQRSSLDRETRFFTVAPVELRDASTEAPKFSGFASTVDQPYTVNDMFGEFEETMVRGAFTRSLARNDNVKLLINHDGIPLASVGSGTLRLSENPHLHAESTLDGASPLVQTVRSAMVRGDLNQMSIGFRVLQQEWSKDYTQRRITEARLIDVSIVTEPANPYTSASLRSQWAETMKRQAILDLLTEVRAGAALSSATMKTLQTVLTSIDDADTSLDEALVALSALMGVTNPDIAQDDALEREALLDLERRTDLLRLRHLAA